MIFNIISRIHSFHLIIYFIVCFSYSHGFVFHDQGYFNFLYYFLLSGITTVLLIPLDFILCLNKRKNNWKIIINYVISIISIFYLFYFLFTSKYANCDEWTKGLNNIFIENEMIVQNMVVKLILQVYVHIITRINSRFFEIKRKKLYEK